MREEEDTEAGRRETMQELADMLSLVQEMGQRLANETHGEAYELVQELNETLHNARGKLDLIRQPLGND